VLASSNQLGLNAAQMMAESKKTLTEKNYGRAIRLSRELLRSEPKNIQAWEVLAISAWAIGEKRIAFHSIDSIIQIDPTSETLTGSLKAIFEQRFNKNGTKS
jgi:Flp pilus assembly protein TadD